MKKKIVISLLFIFVVSQLSARRIEFGDFHRILGKHGNWVSIHGVGLAWTPKYVDRDWKPYTNGRWYWTKYGWFWDSDEQFGWITHHYGRWDYDDYYGWVWHPGYEWAPAWVSWRVSGDYIGWRPLTLNGRFTHARGLYFEKSISIHFSTWNFLRIEYLDKRNPKRYFVRKDRLSRLFRYSKSVNKYRIRNNAVYCDVNVVDRRLRRIMSENIVNPNNTNDFDRIIRFRIDHRSDLPKRTRTKVSKYQASNRNPEPRPLERGSKSAVRKQPSVSDSKTFRFPKKSSSTKSASSNRIPSRVNKGIVMGDDSLKKTNRDTGKIEKTERRKGTLEKRTSIFNKGRG